MMQQNKSTSYNSGEKEIPETLLVHACTWNVASQEPNRSYLQRHFSKLFIDENDQTTMPDIIVLGFQELEMNAKALITEQTEASTVWRSVLSEVLPSYDCIACHQLVGLCIFVWVQFKLARHCSPCMVSEVREGFSRALGNKGSVSVRFKLFNRQFNFINVHLPAHTEKLLERNTALNSIISKTVDDPSLIHSSSLQFHNGTSRNVSITTADDFVIIIGDFNYRIDSYLSCAEVIKKISQGRLAILYKCDQLQKEKRLGRILKGYHEAGTLDFIPTYKCKSFDPSEAMAGIDFNDVSNIFSSKKERVPSWCDRIFYKYNSRIQILQYSSEIKICTSDHKPVVAKMILHIGDNFKEQAIPEAEVVDDLLNFEDIGATSPTESSLSSVSSMNSMSSTSTTDSSNSNSNRKLPPLPKHLLAMKNSVSTEGFESLTQPPNNYSTTTTTTMTEKLVRPASGTFSSANNSDTGNNAVWDFFSEEQQRSQSPPKVLSRVDSNNTYMNDVPMNGNNLSNAGMMFTNNNNIVGYSSGNGNAPNVPQRNSSLTGFAALASRHSKSNTPVTTTSSTNETASSFINTAPSTNNNNTNNSNSGLYNPTSRSLASNDRIPRPLPQPKRVSGTFQQPVVVNSIQQQPVVVQSTMQQQNVQNNVPNSGDSDWWLN